MENTSGKDYLKILRERVKKSRVYSSHQGAGLVLAEILGDQKHKTLYMGLAKQYDSQILLMLAKDVAQREGVKNKGAYFMKMFAGIRRKLKPKPLSKKPKQLKLRLHKKK